MQTELATDSFGKWNDHASVQALVDDGVRCAGRYQYNLSTDEVGLLHSYSRGVTFIGEYDTITWHPILAGYEQGRNHAIDSVFKARRWGWPEGCTLWATADTAVPPDQYARAGLYVQGWTDYVRGAGFNSGLYGGEGLIEWLFTRNLIDKGWGSAARSWNYGVWIDPNRESRFVMRQRIGYVTYGDVVCDLNDVYGDCGDYGPNDNQEGSGDMSADDVKAISDKIDALGLGVLALSIRSEQRVGVTVKGRPELFYMGENENGLPIRVHVPDPDMFNALQNTGYLKSGTLLTLDGDDAAQKPIVDALDRLPMVEMRYVGGS